MRPGPARGTTTSLELVVDGTMTDGDVTSSAPGALPPTFGVHAMARSVARVARELLIEHLEDGELLVPGRLEIILRAPVPVGATVLLEATVQMVEPTRVSIEVIVRTPAGVAARGTYEQEVVTRSAWLTRVGTATP